MERLQSGGCSYIPQPSYNSGTLIQYLLPKSLNISLRNTILTWHTINSTRKLTFGIDLKMLPFLSVVITWARKNRHLIILNHWVFLKYCHEQLKTVTIMSTINLWNVRKWCDRSAYSILSISLSQFWPKRFFFFTYFSL
jgi:hypothetical protein